MPVNTSPKAPSASARAALQRRLANIIASESPHRYWQNRTFNPNLHQLGQLLRLTDPTNTTGSSVATAADMWVAEQLRQAGFNHVVPRLREPYYISPSVSRCYDNGYFDRIDENLERVQASIDRIKDIETGLPADLNRTLAGERQALSRASSALTSAIRQARSRLEQTTASLVGEGRRKQIDVFIADWDRGLELAVSTKTLALGVESLKEQTKNLPNRWEEFDGDLKNLRGRFPLAAIGALLLVSEVTLQSTAIYAITDMMRKLTAPGRDWVNAYDATAIIVVGTWTPGQENAVTVRNAGDLGGQVSNDLQVTRFFSRLMDRVLDRSPISEHGTVRLRRTGTNVDDLNESLNSVGPVSDGSDATIG